MELTVQLQAGCFVGSILGFRITVGAGRMEISQSFHVEHICALCYGALDECCGALWRLLASKSHV